MTTKEIIDSIRDTLAKHDGDERELYNQLMSEAAGWEMRLQELEDEE
jgi:hypothetical protein